MIYYAILKEVPEFEDFYVLFRVENEKVMLKDVMHAEHVKPIVKESIIVGISDNVEELREMVPEGYIDNPKNKNNDYKIISIFINYMEL